MATVNIHHAKTHLSRLLKQVEDGEEITIARAGKPVAKIVPMEPKTPAKKREFGFLKGRSTIPDNLVDFADAEVDEMFFGET